MWAILQQTSLPPLISLLRTRALRIWLQGSGGVTAPATRFLRFQPNPKIPRCLTRLSSSRDCSMLDQAYLCKNFHLDLPQSRRLRRQIRCSPCCTGPTKSTPLPHSSPGHQWINTFLRPSNHKVRMDSTIPGRFISTIWPRHRPSRSSPNLIYPIGVLIHRLSLRSTLGALPCHSHVTLAHRRNTQVRISHIMRPMSSRRSARNLLDHINKQEIPNFCKAFGVPLHLLRSYRRRNLHHIQ